MHVRRFTVSSSISIAVLALGVAGTAHAQVAQCLTFQPSIRAVGTMPRAVALGDFDGDRSERSRRREQWHE